MTQKRNDGLTEYIARSSSSDFVNEMKTAQVRLHNHIDIYIKNPLPKGFDLENVLTKIEQLIPPFLMMDVDAIIIGDFEMFKARDIDALYEDGAIYLTNDQDDEADMFDDVVHEVAHAVEKNYGMEIFGDGQLETEFINKRRVLYSTLNAHGIHNLSMYDYINPEYDKKFDKFLYKTVGYDRLRHMVSGLFLSPYAATSVSEYWANGFEAIFTGEDPKYIKQICPVLHEKLMAIVQAGQFQPADEMEKEEQEGWINDGY
tara:strand:+ start:17164 stop:17940 length:777 start_codon:yes stop_codon:yes gene_type:complete